MGGEYSTYKEIFIQGLGERVVGSRTMVKT